MGIKREKVVISRKAHESIKSIFNRLRREVSLETAQNVRDSIIEKCKGLKNFSGYSKEHYLEGDYRSITIWDYVVIYRVVKDVVRILNVIHTSMHPDQRKDI